ncbi:MAG: glycosyltransferase [Nanoarchaeota archaeon]
METLVIINLVLIFIALYLFSFFVILNIKNRKDMLSYPLAKNIYSVSILIPAYNEENSIKDTIEHVMNLDYPKDKFEVIVLNDGSTDRTKEIVLQCKQKYPSLKILNKPNSGKADSLNMGIKLSKGELIAVVDSDSFPSKESLARLTGYFDNPEMGAVTSFVKVRNEEVNYLTKIQSIEYIIMAWTRKLLDFVNGVFVTNGPLSLYKREYLIKVGGFDKNTVTEDIDITWNLLNSGYKTAMCLSANVTTVVPDKLKDYYHQRVRWGLGGIQAIAKYKKSFFRNGMFGAFIIPFVSFSIIMSLFVLFYSFYISFKTFLQNFVVAKYSISSGVSIFNYDSINFYPSVLLFYLAFLFISSLIYYSYLISKLNYTKKIEIKTFFNLLFYLLIYLSLYLFVWVPAVYRYIRKNNRW